MKNSHLPPSMQEVANGEWKEIGFLFLASCAGLLASIVCALIKVAMELLILPAIDFCKAVWGILGPTSSKSA